MHKKNNEDFDCAALTNVAPSGGYTFDVVMPNYEVYEIRHIDHREPQCIHANAYVPGLALYWEWDSRKQKRNEAGCWKDRVWSAGVHVEEWVAFGSTPLEQFIKSPSSILGTQALGTVWDS